MESIELDLYTLFINRFEDSGGVLTDFPDQPTTTLHSKVQIFYGLLRIILACDAAHDFMSPRGADFDAAEKILFIQGMSEAVKSDLGSVAPGLDTKCENLINYGKYRISGPNSYFNSDAIAKKTVENILNYLGLKFVGLNEIGYGDCTGDYGITRMVKIINFANRGAVNVPGLNFTLRVDATQNSLDMIPIYSSLLMESRLKASDCPNTYNIILEEDITSVFDAANDDKLQKTLKDNKLSVSSINNTSFNISCGTYNVVQCYLALSPTGDVTLKVNRYFNRVGSVSMDNKKNGSVANNSVKGLVKKMKDDSRLAADDTAKRQIIYNYSICKTMGDFLQIVSYLKIVPIDKMFVSADILSTKICSLFSKASFVENVGTVATLSTGMGIYMTQTEVDRQLGASALMIMAGRKRGRSAFGKTSNNLKQMSTQELKNKQKKTEFGMAGGALLLLLRSTASRRLGTQAAAGKKKQKVKNLPNKSIMTKLKSVGIKITKKQGKRRVYLSRPELIKRATAFKNLQTRAKKLKVRIMYKNKKGKYVYKTAKRLMNDIKRRKRMKKPVKKSNVKQMKQRFG